MNVLVACEESQRVCIAFRKKGHRAFSCDILDSQRKRASPRGEAGTSGFLCVSDSDRRVPAEFFRI